MTLFALPRVRPRVALAVVACLLSFTAFWYAQRAADVSMIDVMVYRAEGATVRAGGDLYALRATPVGLPATYPPFAALLFTPLTLVSTSTMRTLATVGNLVLVVVLARYSLLLVGHARVATVWWVAAVAVWSEPVWGTLRYGQVNLLLAVLVLWDLTRRWRHPLAGVGIGIAAAIKLTPGLFIAFLLLTGVAAAVRQGGGVRAALRGAAGVWLRPACVAVATFAGASLLTAAVLPYDSRRFWTEVIFDTSRAGHAEETANQSLRGVLARLLHSGNPGTGWLLVAAVVGAAGLAVAVASALRGERAWAAVACGTTALLVSPVSWSHHWVWCVPMVVLLAREARRRGGAAHWAAVWVSAAVFYSFALWWVPHGPLRPELHQSAPQFTLSALYALTGCAFLVVAGFRVLRGTPRLGDAPPSRLPQAVANE
ncbi:glycosyltransferase 87 family protein [Streptomyces sp. NPDC058001]|uniref:glycosyltransferase 87 family protein n=1 Tax=Streptomyces sp. NPDC058001 TaxID=3346300 RepID=UPI0036F1217F